MLLLPALLTGCGVQHYTDLPTSRKDNYGLRARGSFLAPCTEYCELTKINCYALLDLQSPGRPAS